MARQCIAAIKAAQMWQNNWTLMAKQLKDKRTIKAYQTPVDSDDDDKDDAVAAVDVVVVDGDGDDDDNDDDDIIGIFCDYALY